MSRRLVAAGALGLAVGCTPHPVGPARTDDGYTGKAVTTAESALSAVETVRLAAGAGDDSFGSASWGSSSTPRWAGKVAAVSSRPVFDLVRERMGPTMGMANLIASFFINCLVADIGVHLTLSLEEEEVVTFATERWVRDHVIGHIPGAGDAPG